MRINFSALSVACLLTILPAANAQETGKTTPSPVAPPAQPAAPPAQTAPAQTAVPPEQQKTIVANPTIAECKAGWIEVDKRWTKEQFDSLCQRLTNSK